MTQGPYELVITSTAFRALSAVPPRGVGERVAWAVYEFTRGPLLGQPHRLGKPLGPPLDGTFSARRGSYRVLYEIDDEAKTVTVTAVQHRADAYRPR
ncbi:MAG: type II toxin-antitoxin system RelE family toxin [Pseudonocardiaceae bacterium]